MRRLGFKSTVVLAILGAAAVTTAQAQSSKNGNYYTIADVKGAGDIRILCAFKDLSAGQVAYVQSLPNFSSILDAAVKMCPETALDLTDFATASVGGGAAENDKDDNPVFTGKPDKPRTRSLPPSAPPAEEENGEDGTGKSDGPADGVSNEDGTGKGDGPADGENGSGEDGTGKGDGPADGENGSGEDGTGKGDGPSDGDNESGDGTGKGDGPADGESNEDGNGKGDGPSDNAD